MTIHYYISPANPHRQFVSFEGIFPTHGQDKLTLQLPSWRPGRYELGNFAQNLRALSVRDASGKPLSFVKKSKDCWEITCKNTENVLLTYQYYASELNAGSSWLDETQLYLNPVNCFFYDEQKKDADFELHFDLPDDFEIATGMTALGRHHLHARDFQQLFDCPLIASASLKHWTYLVNEVPFHVWIQGKTNIKKEKLIKEFEAFTQVQMEAFGLFPVSEYHFLFQVPDFPVRHGVEHENSTVIAIGPPELLDTKAWYDELIGISSHELYHTWNVKFLRPADMVPYDFRGENYSRLGYAVEGITTYMGDKMLLRSGYFSDKEMLGLLSETLQKHLDNPGRFNLSVADSSFDTWLDGYKPGIPWRKVSIYNEGCLTAFMTDVLLLQHSGGKHSLDTVMKDLCVRFARKGKGYTEADYRKAVSKAAGRDLNELFDKLIYGTEDYVPLMAECCEYLGLEIRLVPSGRFSETFWGIRSENNRVMLLMPDSPADRAGMWVGDQIMSIDGRSTEGDFDALARHFGSGGRLVIVKRHGKLKPLKLKITSKAAWPKVEVVKMSKAGHAQNQMFETWKSGEQL